MSELYPFSAAESSLIDAVRAGQTADYRVARKSSATDAEDTDWGAERTVRASVIRAILDGSIAGSRITQGGVRIRGARILGEMNLAGAVIRGPLELAGCRIEQPLSLSRSRLEWLSLSGSHIG